MNKMLTLENQIKMNSLEIAKLCKKRHDHVMRDIRNMIESIGLNESPQIWGRYKDSKGQYQPCAYLEFDLLMTLLTGYRVELRHKVICRWMELEKQRTSIVDEPFDPEWRGYAMRQLTMENDLLRGELDRYDDLFDNTKKLAESVLHKAVVKAEEVKKSSVVRGVRIDRRGTIEIIRERSDG